MIGTRTESTVSSNASALRLNAPADTRRASGLLRRAHSQISSGQSVLTTGEAVMTVGDPRCGIRRVAGTSAGHRQSFEVRHEQHVRDQVAPR